MTQTLTTRPIPALIRQIVAPAAVFWLLTRLLGVGLTGIWRGIFGINQDGTLRSSGG